ncbi:hypothetical protein EW146_g10246, partial [Bondarzewia mesenterica]
WQSPAALQDFKSSPAYKHLLTALSSLYPTSNSPSNATSTTISFGRTLTYQPLHPHTQLRHVYFPTPLTPSRLAAIDAIQGLVYPYFFGISVTSTSAHKYAYRTRPTKGWVEGTRKWEGEECEVLMWVMFWKGREEEREFLEGVKRLRTRKGAEDGTAVYEGEVSVFEIWENELRGQGALGWVDEYVDFEMVPGFFKGDPWP